MKKKKDHPMWNDFKKFINRGNVVDMAVGVIMASSFGAIVNAFTKLLITLCTWGVPGGISGLITVLPAINPSQKLPTGLKFENGEEVTSAILNVSQWAALEDVKTQGLFTKYGGYYVYSGSPVLDWGNLINSVITFLVIALVLFMILRIFNKIKTKRKEFELKRLEKYYEEHPEERPLPPEEKPKEPTELDVLKEIKEIMLLNKTDHKVEE